MQHFTQDAIKSAVLFQAIQSAQLVEQMSGVQQQNASLAAALQERDKQIEALKATNAAQAAEIAALKNPPPAAPAADEAAPERAPRQPVEVSEGGTPD